MGQIVTSTAKPKRCNLSALQNTTSGHLGATTPAAGEIILVSSDNSMDANGQGNFDCYIVGDGTTAAISLEIKQVYDIENTLGDIIEYIEPTFNDGKYINASGNVANSANWKCSDFLNVNAVAVGDTFIWSGIKSDSGNCIAFYDENDNFLQAKSATGTSRTFTVASNDTMVGATKVRASFLINGTPSLSHNGADVLKENSYYAVSGMTELRNDVDNLNVVVPMLSEFKQEAEPIVLNLQEYDYYDKSQTSGIRIRFIYRNILGAVVQVSCQEGYSFAIAYYAGESPTGNSLYDSGWLTSEASINIPSTGVGCLTINTRKSNNATITYEESVANVDKMVYIGSRKVSENVSEGSTDLITSGAVYAALNGGNDYAYSGDRIRLLLNKFDGHEYMALRHPSVSASGQGGGVYGDYFVQGGDGGHARVYNLSTKSIVVDSMDLAVVASTNHVNNIVFGKDFPTEGTFPYMYVSECNGQGRCFVENFNLEGSTLVQTINYDGSDIYGRNWVIDAEKGFIYLIGDTKSAYNIQGNMIRVKKFTLPLPSAGGDVVFTANDVLDTFDMDGSTGKAYVLQGHVIFNGKLYSCFGGAYTTHRVWVNNLDTHELETVIELDQMYAGECESINIWNNSLLIGYPNQSKLYQLTF